MFFFFQEIQKNLKIFSSFLKESFFLSDFFSATNFRCHPRSKPERAFKIALPCRDLSTKKMARTKTAGLARHALFTISDRTTCARCAGTRESLHTLVLTPRRAPRRTRCSRVGMSSNISRIMRKLLRQTY